MKKISTTKKISFILFSCFLIMVLFEIVLGILFYFKDIRNQLIHVDSIKDSPYTYYNKQSEEEKLDKEKNKGFKYKIVIIGGSVATNIGNAKKDGGSMLQHYLNKSLNTNCIELMNKGVPGYVIEQEYILSQLNIQHIKPNIVFSVDGYNDLLSINMNRNSSFEAIPPQNYKDFQVIKNGKIKNSFFGRFRAVFKNLERFYYFSNRFLNKQSLNDYSDLNEEKQNKLSKIYLNIVQDTKDFYDSKGTNYIHFLQPIKFYTAKKEKYNGIESLNPIYNIIENKIKNSDYGYSLTTILDLNKNVYKDYCHVNAEGHEIFSKKIADLLTIQIKNDTTFQKINNY